MLYEIITGRIQLLVAAAICFCLAGVAVGQQSPATPSRSQASVKLENETAKAKREIQRIGVGHKVTVIRRDGQQFAGKISEVKDSSVILDEVDLKAKVEVEYEHITHVESGYGGKGIQGKRVLPHRSRNSTFILIGVLAAILLPVLLSKD